MNTLVEEATLQFLQESKGLFDNLPMFGVDAGDLILQIKSNNTSLPGTAQGTGMAAGLHSLDQKE